MGQKGILGCSFQPKRSQIGQEMAELWLFSHWEAGWFHWEPHGTNGDPWMFVHLNQKDPKSFKKWLSYGYFPAEMLHDSIENHMGQKWILSCSFKPKRSKISQEIAELWLFSHWEVEWFHWEPHGTKGNPWVFICTEKIHNPSRNG